MRILFTLFIIINILFGAVLSSFLGIRNQIQEQISDKIGLNSNIAESFIINNPNKILKTQNFHIVFCTDYFEIRKKTKIGKKETTKVKRLSKTTVGGKQGCFQKPQKKFTAYKMFVFDFLQNRPRIIYFKTDWRLNNELKINSQSIYYQKSIHGRLMKKYQQTKNPKYLEMAGILKHMFETIILQALEKKLLQKAQMIALTRNVRQREINQLMTVRKIKETLEKRQKLLLSKYQKGQETQLLQYLNAQLISENRRNLIRNFINQIRMNKVQMLSQSKSETKKNIDQLMRLFDVWDKAKLLKNFAAISTVQITQYQRWLLRINTKWNNDRANFLEFLLSFITPQYLRYLIYWVKDQLSKYNKLTSTRIKDQTHWILSRWTLIKNVILEKVFTNNPQLLLFHKIEQFLALIQNYQNSQLNYQTFAFKFNTKLSWQQIQTQIVKGTVTKQEREKITKQIDKLTNTIDKHKKIKAFIQNQTIWTKLTKTIIAFLTKMYQNPQKIIAVLNKPKIFQSIIDQPNTMNEIVIDQIYQNIINKMHQLTLFNAKMIETFYNVRQIFFNFNFNQNWNITINNDGIFFKQYWTKFSKINNFQINLKASGVTFTWSPFLLIWESQKMDLNQNSNKLHNLERIVRIGYEILIKAYDEIISKMTKIDNYSQLKWPKNVHQFQIFQKLSIAKKITKINENERGWHFWSTIAELITTMTIVKRYGWENKFFHQNNDPIKVLVYHRFGFFFSDNSWTLTWPPRLSSIWDTTKKQFQNSIYAADGMFGLFKTVIYVLEEEYLIRKRPNTDREKARWYWYKENTWFLGKNCPTNTWWNFCEYDVTSAVAWYQQFIFDTKQMIVAEKTQHVKLKDNIQDQGNIKIKKDEIPNWSKNNPQNYFFFWKHNKALNDLIIYINTLIAQKYGAFNFQSDNSAQTLNSKNYLPTFKFGKERAIVTNRLLPSELMFSESNLQIIEKTAKQKINNNNLYQELLAEINDLIKKGFNIDQYQQLFATFADDQLVSSLLAKETSDVIPENQQVWTYQKKSPLPSTWLSVGRKMFVWNLWNNLWTTFPTKAEPSWASDILKWEIEGDKNHLNFIDNSDIQKNLQLEWNDPTIIKNDNTFYQYLRDKDLGEKNVFIKKVIASIYDFQTRELKALFLSNERQNQKYLFVEKNPDLNFKLTAGRNIQYNNEVIISPTYARNKQIKIGQIINLMGMNNIKVVGIGIQEEFYYPLISIFEVIPKKEDAIVYLNANLMAILRTKIKRELTPYYQEWRHQLFLNYQKTDPKSKKADLAQLEMLYGMGKTNNTETLFKINDQTNKFTTFQKPRKEEEGILSIDQFKTFPYKLINSFVKLNYAFIDKSAIFIMIFFSIIVSFITFYMINKKIELNLKQLGILKSLGIKNRSIFLSALPLLILVFFAIFVGWVSSVFVQLIIFEQMEKMLNITFRRYYFDFTNLGVAIGIIFGVIIVTFASYNKLKFQKLSTLKMIYPAVKKPNPILNKIRDLFFVKTKLTKFLFIKINYLFFAITWKKIMILLLVAIFTSVVIIANSFFITITKTTIAKNYQNINYNWEVSYQDNVAGSPWSRKQILINRGYHAIKNTPPQSLEPIPNWGVSFYIDDRPIYFKNNQDGWFIEEKDGRRIKKLEFKELVSLFLVAFPLYNKIFNYNWIFRILKSIPGKNDKEKEENFCVVFGRIAKNLIGTTQKIQKNCISRYLNVVLPIKLENKDKVVKQVPVSIGTTVSFNPETDEFFTKLQAKMVEQKNVPEFTIYGLAKNTQAWRFAKKDAKRVFQRHQQDEQKNIIPIIANSMFLRKTGLKIGDQFKIAYKRPYVCYVPNPQKSNECFKIQNNDWYYQNTEGKKIPITAVSANARWYRGSLFNQLKNFKISKDGVYFSENDADKKQWKKIRLLYKDQNSNYKEWFDIERVFLKLPNNIIIKPFEQTDISKFEDWWSKAVLSDRIQLKYEDKKSTKTLLIVNHLEEYNKAKIFMYQGYANELLDLPQTKNNDGNFQWFNGKTSKMPKIEDVFFGLSFASKLGYINADILANYKLPNIESVDAIMIKKTSLQKIVNYFLNLNLLFIISVSILMVFFFLFIVAGTLKQIREIGLKLKIMGYSKKIILLNCLQILMLPILVGYVVSIYLVNLLFTNFMNALSQNMEIQLYWDNSTWIFLTIFFFIILLALIIFIINAKIIKKTNLVKLVS